MRRFATLGTIVLLVGGCASAPEPPAPDPTPPEAPALGEGWIGLFDGKSLEGWKAAENSDSFAVRGGMIVVNGPRAHLYYAGDLEDHDFTNFELRADVMTRPGANSGIYFHTRYQATDWPKLGYEVQVNNSHEDWKRTGSIYDVENMAESPAEDGAWFTIEIIVRGKQVITKADGRTLVDYTEPEDPQRPEGWEGRRLSSGTFALQAHDPNSMAYFANIMVKPLPD